MPPSVDVVEAEALALVARGFALAIYDRGRKAANEPGWQQMRLSEQDVRDRVRANRLNVGIVTGEASGGLVDVDLDVPEARDLASEFLPPTGMVHGRVSNPRSHWWYRCSDLKTKKFQVSAGLGALVGETDPPWKGMVVEIRSNGCQTMVPPSVHPSGELVEWAERGEPAEVAPADLTAAVARLAAAAVLLRAGLSRDAAVAAARAGLVPDAGADGTILSLARRWLKPCGDAKAGAPQDGPPSDAPARLARLRRLAAEPCDGSRHDRALKIALVGFESGVPDDDVRTVVTEFATTSKLVDARVAEGKDPAAEIRGILAWAKDKVAQSPPAAGGGAPDGESKEEQKKRDARKAAYLATFASVRKFIDAHVRIDALGSWSWAPGFLPEGSPPVSLTEAIFVDYMLHYFRQEGDQVNAPVMAGIVRILAANAREDRRAALVRRITGQDVTPEGEAGLRTFLRAVTGAEDPRDLVALRQLMWLVKRRALGLPVEAHLMPIFSGPQGAGKSRAVARLLQPLEELAVLQGTVGMLTDDRELPVLEDALVIFWDELGGASKADSERIKQVITADRLSYRPMRTNSRQYLAVSASFIGATNRDLAGLFADVTGGRRFWEIKAVERERFDRAALNALDPWTLWSAVHEDDPAPLTEEAEPGKTWADVLRPIQDGYRRVDSVAAWLEDETWETPGLSTAGQYVPGVGMKKEALRRRYASWCQANAEIPVPSSVWVARLGELGFVKHRPRGGDGTRPYLWLRPGDAPATAAAGATA